MNLKLTNLSAGVAGLRAFFYVAIVLSFASSVISIAFGQSTTKLDLANQGRNPDFANSGFTRPIAVGATLPNSCVVGQLFFNSSSPAGANIYECTSINTWTSSNPAGSNVPLPVANGGTGTSTPGLVAGANVTVTGAWPNQTISASNSSAGGASTPATSSLLKGSGSANGVVAATANTDFQPSTTFTVQGADASGSADSTAAFKAALAATPSGTITIPPGMYMISATLSLNRNQQLKGAGAKSSMLNCTMISTPCVVVADTTLGPNNYAVTNIEDIGLTGPASGNTGSVGVYIGGDPSGVVSSASAFADYVNLASVRISGFYSGVQFGNNAYSNKLERCAIAGNTLGVYFPSGIANSGEAMSITDTDIFNNSSYGLNANGGGEWFVTGSSFDYNGEAINETGGTMMINHTHFEENNAPVMTGSSGYANVSIQDSEFLVQSTTAATDIFDFYFAGVNLTLNHLNIYSNAVIGGMIRFAPGSAVVSGTIQNVAYNSNVMALGTTAYSNPDLIVSNNGVSGGKINYGCDTSQGAGFLNVCGQTTQTPINLQIFDTTYSGSFHTGIQLGSNWLIEQDTASSGTKDFAIRNTGANSNPIAVNASGTTVTVPNLTVTGTCTGCGGSGSASTFTPSPTRVVAFGDSITNNTGSTNNAGNGWAQVVGSSLTGQLTDNEGIGGTSTCNGSLIEVWSYYQPTTAQPILYTYMFGTNDANNFGGGPYEVTATLCRNAALEWLAVPASSKTYGQNCTLSSNMTNANGIIGGVTYPAGIAIYSTATGAQFTCTIATIGTNPIYLWYDAKDSDPGASFSYSLDGGTAVSQNIQFVTSSQYGTAVASVRIPVSSGGTHAVTVIVNSSNNEFFWGIGTVPPVAYGNPRVIVNGVPKQRTQNTDTSQNTAAYNSDAQASVVSLASDGLNVQFANIRAALCTQYVSGVCANSAGTPDMNDTLHPNDQGHGEIAQQTLQTAALPANFPVNTIPTLIATTGTVNLSTAAFGSLTKVNSGSRAGSLISGTTGSVGFTLSPIPLASPSNFQAPLTGWNCNFNDQTTPTGSVKQSATTQTTITASGTVVAGDIISYTCSPY